MPGCVKMFLGINGACESCRLIENEGNEKIHLSCLVLETYSMPSKEKDDKSYRKLRLRPLR